MGETKRTLRERLNLPYSDRGEGTFEAPLAKKLNNFKTNKFSDVTNNYVILRHCVNQVIQRSWK